MMKLAIVGIRGIPNNYGGFETLTENLVEHLTDVQITVYCSSTDINTTLEEYKGARLRYIPITSHGGLGILYDSLALLDAVHRCDRVLFLGFGGGFLMPFIKKHRNKIILNIGGLDWKRSKWSPLAQRVIKKAEALLVKNSRDIVSDNIGIQKYLADEYGRASTLIAYGGDQARKREITQGAIDNYPFLNRDYAFSVTRIQPDNNIDMILEAFSHQSIPVVIVGNWDNSLYGIKTRSKYHGRENIILLDAIYDRDKLDVLRSNCTVYIHGHSAGGTNPSLTEAMYLGLPVFAYASGYNEYTTHNQALYFSSAAELAELVKCYKTLNLEETGSRLHEIALEHYRWKKIADEYKEVIFKKVN